MVDVTTAFVDAFNAGDLARLRALLAPDATAEVMGSRFPVERGPADIEAKSLTHMLSWSPERLRAERFVRDGADWLLFLDPGSGALEAAATIVGSGLITRIEYFVGWHRPQVLAALGAARGVTVAKPS